MANVAHATLTGADLHEPKGIGTASNGTVYVANGSGSGAWSSATSIFAITGMIADFATPVAPSGWLECTGSAVSRTTFAALFSALTIQQNGVRTNGSAIITGLSATNNIGSGYFVSGTGIPLGATVVSVDSPSQITISAACTSSGTSNVIISPWALGDGSTTFNLPNTFTSGRYRRSRGVQGMGTSLADIVKNHTHGPGTLTGSLNSGQGTNASTGLAHTHGPGTLAGSTSTDGDHTHAAATGNFVETGGGSSGATGAGLASNNATASAGSHSHTVGISTGATASTDLNHAHTVGQLALTVTSGATAGNDGTATETRPITIVVMTCIKT